MLEIHLNGCQWSHKRLATVKARLSDLLNQAPSGAGLFSYIEKDQSGYSGVLRVHSSVGHFVAYASQKTPEQLLMHLSKAVRHQLENWQSHVHVS